MVEWDVASLVENNIRGIQNELSRQWMISEETKKFILTLIDDLYKEVNMIETL